MAKRSKLCCNMRRMFAIGLVALEPSDVEVADLIVDWGGANRPIVIAFRFCPFCGAAQSIAEQVKAYDKFRATDDS